MHPYSILLFILSYLLIGCNRHTDPTSCTEQPTKARFQVNGTEYASPDQMVWLRNGTQNSLNFMQQDMQGEQHVVIVIFNGTESGEYTLLGVNDENRAAYFAPGVNGTVFPDSIIPGTLLITDFETDPYCLSGSYNFLVDTIHVSGVFQGLRSD